MLQGSEQPASGNGVAPAAGSPPGPWRRGPGWAWGAFALLLLVHLLDSLDRWMLPAIARDVAADLALSDAQAGWLATVLLLGFAVWCPIIGYLADRLSRPRLMALGIAVWSIATVATSLARTYDQLVAVRALVGVGSATTGVLALTLLMDLFPRGERARVLSAYYLAMPLGAALGLGGGAALARAADWHTAFLIVGAPGLILALLALGLPNPVRGASEGVDEGRLRLHERVGPSQEDYIDLMVNSSYTYSVFALAFSMFAIAGLIYWLPTFLAIDRQFPRSTVATWLSVEVPAAMVVGMLLGGWLADRWARGRPRALFLVPAAATLASIPFVLLAVLGHSPVTTGLGIFAALALMFSLVGPCLAIIAGVVMPNMRGVACAVALAAMHLLGDLWSPSLLGWIAEEAGQPDFMATALGRALAAVGATPHALPGQDPQNLAAALLAAVPALVFSGVVLLAGARHLPREMAHMLAKLRAVPALAARAASAQRPAPPRPASRD